MADVQLTPRAAVADAVNNVTCDLGYVGILAEALLDHVVSSAHVDQNRVEALARAISVMNDKVRGDLQAEVDKFEERHHG